MCLCFFRIDIFQLKTKINKLNDRRNLHRNFLVWKQETQNKPCYIFWVRFKGYRYRRGLPLDQMCSKHSGCEYVGVYIGT